MDEQRFDDLTRLIATGATRRRVLGGIGGLVVGLLSRLPAGAQCENPQTCELDTDCCSGACVDSTCIYCQPPGAACQFGDDCCDSKCVEGFCACREQGAACTFRVDCCSRLCTDGQCAELDCHADGSACADNSACCNGSCLGSICSTCLPTGQACSDSDGCCSGVCFGGVCADCIIEGNEQCRSGMDCCTGTCAETEMGETCIPCNSFGIACSAGEGCCSGVCAGGICAPYACGSQFFPDCSLGQSCIDGFCYPDEFTCTSDAQCVHGICCGSQCRTVECCSADADADARCPGGEMCIQNTCASATVPTSTPVGPAPTAVPTSGSINQLPNTGAGINATGRNTGIALAMSGAVVAALARLGMRRRPS